MLAGRAGDFSPTPVPANAFPVDPEFGRGGYWLLVMPVLELILRFRISMSSTS